MTFCKNIVALKNEQGPGIGAAMIAAMGCNWFKNWNSCINVFVKYSEIIAPDPHNTALYKKYYHLYHKIYNFTTPLARAATKL
ncbi:MAG: hypothetical protein M3Z87_14655 [Lactobacillus sp.]|nr:hypothetical protein [Lactobacillus sp.]